MRHIRLLLLATAIAFMIPACHEALGGDVVSVAGTVHYYKLEGGFWAVRGDDATTYDPLGGVPSDFRQENLRVLLKAKVRSDVVGIHMIGPIVEIVSIRRL